MNKEELSQGCDGWDSPSCHDHEMAEFKILRGQNKTNRPLMSGAGNMVMKNRDNAEVLSIILSLVFTGKTGLQQPQLLETTGKVISKTHPCMGGPG